MDRWSFLRDKNLSIEEEFGTRCEALFSLVRRWPCLMDAFQGRSRRRCKQRFSIWSTCRQIVAEHDWGRPERAEGNIGISTRRKNLAPYALSRHPATRPKIIVYETSRRNQLGISLPFHEYRRAPLVKRSKRAKCRDGYAFRTTRETWNSGTPTDL